MNALLRGLLLRANPETAHKLSALALRSGLLPSNPPRSTPRLALRVAGIDFPNPVGVAAGYDKDGRAPLQLIGLGFGFSEVGTVTPLPQHGNPRPRIFRLTRDRAVINRLGFNNLGHAACLALLNALNPGKRVIGVNIGANKTSEDKISDYEKGIETFAHIASYFAINISSPNTPGLRDLQSRDRLRELLTRTRDRRDRMAIEAGRAAPLFLKIAPDLHERDLDHIADEVERSGIEGLIVSNTTLERKGLIDARYSAEAGGLSGRPLFEKSTAVLAKMRERCGSRPAIIGVGGVDSTETALEKIRAGADLVQLYTGFIYGGPATPGRIVAGLERYAEKEQLQNIRDIRDSNLRKWAAKSL